MISLRSCFFVFAFAPILAGCPQGSAGEVFDLDAGDDAAAVALSDDADVDAFAPSGTGALCGPDGRDECGLYSVCDATLGCVECIGDDDCPTSAGHCLVGECVGCRPGTGDCPAGSTCWTSDFQCHPRCAGAGSCPDGATCDESSGECVGCSETIPCADGVCSMARRECVECEADAHCPSVRPRCHVARGQCVTCTSNDDCGRAAPFCDPFTFACAALPEPAPPPEDAGADAD